MVALTNQISLLLVSVLSRCWKHGYLEISLKLLVQSFSKHLGERFSLLSKI
jgi:hypothetical protein